MKYKTAAILIALLAAIATGIGTFYQVNSSQSNPENATTNITKMDGSNNVNVQGSDNVNVLGSNSTLIQGSQFETPEKDIATLALRTGRTESLTMEEMLPFIDHYKFEPWMDEGEFKTFLMYSLGRDPSPTPRMILWFARGNLCAVLHEKDVDINSDASEEFFFGMLTFTFWCYHHEDNLHFELKETYGPMLEIAD